MLVIGIDPGTARTGYAILEVQKNKKPSLKDFSVIKTPKELDMPHRLNLLHKNLDEIVKTQSPDTMVIEKLFFNTNAKTAINVGQARGISLLVAAKRGLNVFEYTALEAKVVLTGYGRAKKIDVQNAVKDFFNLDKIIKPDDACDAVAIALCFLSKNSEFSGIMHNATTNKKT